MALNSPAFIVGYGGAGGGGKTDLLLGAALESRKATIFRRDYGQLDDIVLRSHEIFAEAEDKGFAKFNASRFVWNGTWRDRDSVLATRRIQMAGILREEDLLAKWRGRTRDFLGIDEATEWNENMILLLIGWVRSVVLTQRTRVILTFNPPTSAEGQWVLRFFAPWLDDKHPNPAKAGELRWFVRINDVDTEVPDNTPVPELDEYKQPVLNDEGLPQFLYPQSRTFIPAKLKDNPILSRTNYGQQLSMLPEPLRSQLRNGDFKAGLKDDEWQLIPTKWVDLAMERWKRTPRPRDEKGKFIPMSCLGVDPSRGGDDEFALAPRYDNWFDEVTAHPGSSAQNGTAGANHVMKAWNIGARINIDALGVGGSVYDELVKRADEMSEATKDEGEDSVDMQVVGVNVANPSKLRDLSGKFRLVNVRAVMWWKFREALDPSQRGGSKICLPPDMKLRADLCAPRYFITTEGIMVEPKVDPKGGTTGIKKRLGRSPDRGEAVLLAYFGSWENYFVAG